MMKDPWHRVLLLTFLVLVINGLFVYMFPPVTREPVIEIAYSRFKDEVRLDHVAAVTIQGEVLTGRFTEQLATFYEEAPTDKSGEPRAYHQFRTNLPPIDDPDLMPLLERYQVVVNVEPPEERSDLITLLANLLPWIMIFGIWWFIYQRTRQQGGLGGGLMNRFSKSGASLFLRQDSSKTFQDVAGLEEAKQELQEVIEYLREPQKFYKLGGKMPRGVLLVGPPGTGKTLMARAVAGEADVPFYSISASQFVEMFVGVGASRVRDLFTNAKQNAPSIIFIDELDAVGRARGAGLGGGNDEREQTLNQMLSELDGFEPHDEVIVMAATNRPDVLDSALLRPGRFDRQVVIDRPDWRDRVKILEVHTRDVPLAEDVDLAIIAKGTPGMVGADLQGLVNEAALIAARENADQVCLYHLEQAKDRQLMGMERKLYLTDQEKRITAIHESGHALVARCLPNTDPIHKVTIIPRGQALGMTQQLPEDDCYHYQRSGLLARLAVALGGRAAEKLIFGEYSTGAQNDLKQDMALAEKMVCQWGMSEKIGPLSFDRGEEHPFLGLKLATEKTFSEKTAWIIDQEIEKLVHIAQECAELVLAENRDVLEALAESLFEEETLDEERLKEFFQDRRLQLPDKARAALYASA
ncbi:ATP-dependent zinc metalloprotease FtsH [Deltaproteobacteria bacterium IMCC39524]|nr:ATP-dependent zinc metalloprotease FtsH [Deltaproteobacteria bacterium IMCC39524]